MLLAIAEVVPATTQLTSIELLLLGVAVVVIFGSGAYGLWMCKGVFAMLPPEILLGVLVHIYPPEVIQAALPAVCATISSWCES